METEAALSTSPEICIVVPAFNEVRRIAFTIERTEAFLAATMPAGAFEVIVVDDGSVDGTGDRVRDLARSRAWLRVLGGEPNRGKGYATRRGVLASTGRYVGYMDADYKTPIEEVQKFLPHLRDGRDVVIGSRTGEGARIEVAQPLYRRIGSRAFSVLMHRLVGLDAISDTQCGFKFFRRDVAQELFGRQAIDGYMFDVEILALSELMGYSIVQVPIRWQNDPDSRYNPVTGTIRNARELLRIRAALRRREIRELARSAVTVSSDADVHEARV